MKDHKLFSLFSNLQVQVPFWRSFAIGRFVSIFVFKDSSSAVLLSVVEILLSVCWTVVVVKSGLRWWLRRSSVSLVIHKEKIDNGLSVALGWIRDQADRTFVNSFEIDPPLLLLGSLFGHADPWMSVSFQQELCNSWNGWAHRDIGKCGIIPESVDLFKTVFADAVVYQQGVRDFHFGPFPSGLPASVCMFKPFLVRRLQLTTPQRHTIFIRTYLLYSWLRGNNNFFMADSISSHFLSPHSPYPRIVHLVLKAKASH